MLYENTCHFIYTKVLYLCTVVRFCSGTQYFQPCQKCVTCAELHSPVHRDSTFDISYVFNEEFYKFYIKKIGVEFKPMVIVMVMVMMVMLMVM